MSKKRTYTAEERAASLASYKANGGNLKRTAAECGVPVPTLRSWVLAAGLNPEATGIEPLKSEIAVRARELAQEAEANMAAMIQEIVYEMLNMVRSACRPGKGKKLAIDCMNDGVKAMTIAGIGIEKLKLLAGSPEITASAVVDSARRRYTEEELREMPYDKLLTLHKELLG